MPRAQTTPSHRGLDEEVLGSFRGDIAPVKPPPHYVLGLFFVAVAMLLLPLVYVGLIGLTGYLLYYHATVNQAIFHTTKSTKGALFIYVAPLVVGGILILFMVKPLFARRAREAKPRSLRRDDEPLLFAFVERLCRAVGAPAPREIHADADLNASAGFRRGAISMLTGGDLVLTIGLPMVAGLSLQQFAGVLAHEFGHFSQGVAMRMTYVIRSVNAWFARVVYERDSWDERLVSWSRGIDLRIGVVFYVARFFVWITRKVLWALMLVGHGISCFMMRQMEYDADRHEARLAGADEFEATMRRVTELSVAMQGAHADLKASWDEGRLADDMTALILANVVQIPPRVRNLIEKDLAETKTGLFDTHPAARDRIASAREEKAPGAFRSDRPATDLFADFGALAKSVSLDFYAAVLERKMKPEDLCPAEELIRRQGREQEGGKALGRYFQDGLRPLRPLALPAEFPAPPADVAGAEDAVAALKSARERMLEALPAYKEAFKSYDDADTHIIEATQAKALLMAGFKIKANEFHLPKAEIVAAVAEEKKARREQEALTTSLYPFETAACERLLGALGLLSAPSVAAKVPDAEAVRAEAAALLPATKSVAALIPDMTEVRNASQALIVLLSNYKGNEGSEKVVDAIRGQMKAVHDLLKKTDATLGSTDYPFDHAKGKITLHAYALPDVPPADDPGALLGAGRELLDKVFTLYFRLMGRLALAAEKVEQAVGLPPLPELPEEAAKGEKDEGDGEE